MKPHKRFQEFEKQARKQGVKVIRDPGHLPEGNRATVGSTKFKTKIQILKEQHGGDTSMGKEKEINKRIPYDQKPVSIVEAPDTIQQRRNLGKKTK